MAGRKDRAARLLVEGLRYARAGQIAVEPEPGADHVVARAGEGHRACRVRRVEHRRRHPGPGQGGHDRVETVELRLGVGHVAGLEPVGHRQVGPHARQLERRRRHHGGGQLGQLLGWRADAVHAGVDLEVDRRAAPPPGRFGGDGGNGGARVERRREPVGQRGLHRVGAALAQQQDGRRDPVLAQLDALVDQRHRQLRRPAGQRGPGHCRATVAVTVGLHDRAEPGRGGQGGQDRRVVRDRGQVDFGPGRTRAALGHGHLAGPRCQAHRRGQAGARAGGLSHGPVPTARPPPTRAGLRPPGRPGGPGQRPARARAPPAPPPGAPARPGPGRRR